MGCCLVVTMAGVTSGLPRDARCPAMPGIGSDVKVAPVLRDLVLSQWAFMMVNALLTCKHKASFTVLISLEYTSLCSYVDFPFS